MPFVNPEDPVKFQGVVPASPPPLPPKSGKDSDPGALEVVPDISVFEKFKFVIEKIPIWNYDRLIEKESYILWDYHIVVSHSNPQRLIIYGKDGLTDVIVDIASSWPNNEELVLMRSPLTVDLEQSMEILKWLYEHVEEITNRRVNGVKKTNAEKVAACLEALKTTKI